MNDNQRVALFLLESQLFVAERKLNWLKEVNYPTSKDQMKLLEIEVESLKEMIKPFYKNEGRNK